MHIEYHKSFLKEYLKLPAKTQKQYNKAEQLFIQNSNHPSLRIHKLQGKLKDYHSFSINRSYRVIYRATGETVTFIFLSIGTHDIYK